MKQTINNWVEVPSGDETYFTDVSKLPKNDRFRKAVEKGQIDWFFKDSVLALYDQANGSRLPINFIPYYGIAPVDVIGINVLYPSRGWKNIIELIDGEKNNELVVVFYQPDTSLEVVIKKLKDGRFEVRRNRAKTDYDNKISLLTTLMAGCMIPANLAKHFKGIPNVIQTKKYLQMFDDETYAKKMFARECGEKARLQSLPFKMLLKMRGDEVLVATLVASLNKIEAIADADAAIFHMPAHLLAAFDKYNIECPKELVRNVGEVVCELLEEKGKLNSDYFHSIAVKNPKAESSVLKKSAFFKTSFGLIITRGSGTTYRRNHQGSNGWSLYNIEGELPKRPTVTRKEGWVNFGTYYGEEDHIPWLYEKDLIPISYQEWEAITGRKFVIKAEFSWFHADVVLHGVSLVLGENTVEAISTLKCYRGLHQTLAVNNLDNFMYNGVICEFWGVTINIKSEFSTRKEAQRQSKLVGNAYVVKEDDKYIVYQYDVSKVPPAEIRFLSVKKADFKSLKKVPKDGWYRLDLESAQDKFALGRLNYNDKATVIWVEKGFILYPTTVKIESGQIVATLTSHIVHS